MIDRRQFLAASSAAMLAAQSRAAAADDDGGDRKIFRAAVIGHTGRGEYGHGLDLVFAGRDNVRVVAVADPDEAGLAKALKRIKAERPYADYRQMLEKERPQLVSVCPRTTGEHRDMLLAALNVGAHVVCEKPFTRSPAEADEVLAVAEKNNLKIAVAHQMRMAPAVVHLKRKMDDGLIGDLVEMRAWGKQDKRAGGEDLTVLGIHLFDLMRLFAGDAQWCQAAVLEKGRPATLADARPATEDIGLILGDQIHAQFGFDKGVVAGYATNAKLRESVGHWGVEFVGTKGAARVLADIWATAFFKPHAKWTDAGREEHWQPLPDDPTANATPAQRGNGPANARMVDDWLAAIAENRLPTCSAQNAAKAIEMAHAVWQSGLTGARVPLPLKNRAHALQN